jgi:hypothetical protein
MNSVPDRKRTPLISHIDNCSSYIIWHQLRRSQMFVLGHDGTPQSDHMTSELGSAAEVLEVKDGAGEKQE